MIRIEGHVNRDRFGANPHPAVKNQPVRVAFCNRVDSLVGAGKDGLPDAKAPVLCAVRPGPIAVFAEETDTARDEELNVPQETSHTGAHEDRPRSQTTKVKQNHF